MYTLVYTDNSICNYVFDVKIMYLGIQEPYSMYNIVGLSPRTRSKSWTNSDKRLNWQASDYKALTQAVGFTIFPHKNFISKIVNQGVFKHKKTKTKT